MIIKRTSWQIWLATGAGVAVAWIAVLALVLRFTGDAPAALVVFPSDAFLQNLPSGIAILDASSFTVSLIGITPNFVADLYASGAWLVLPAGLTGCGG